MKALKNIFLFSLIATAFAACKKETLQPGNTTNGSAVFYFNGMVNSAPVSMSAGVNNYYMYSSYTQDANNVYNFTANLQQVGNPKNSIQIIINDYKACAPSAAETHITDSSLVVANYGYLTPSGGTPASYRVAFHPYTYDSVSYHHWNFGDGDTTGWKLTTPVHTYKQRGDYTVTLTVGDSCNSSISNPVNMGTPNASMQTKVYATSVVNDSISLSLNITGGTSPYTYAWNFGDGNTSSSPAPLVHNYVVPGNYLISVTTTDATGLTSTAKLDTTTQGYSPHCVANFTDTVMPTPNPLALSNITIVYTDANGNTYSSAAITQPTASAFQLTQVSSYQNNELNETTKMLRIKFNCQLKGTAGTITVTNGNAVVAVAYK